MSRLRRLTICDHGISGCRTRTSGETRPAASPITSSKRIRARFNSRSESRSARVLPVLKATASRAWSSAWRMLIASSRRDIQRHRLVKHVVAEVRTEEADGIQVNCAAQHLRQLILHSEEREAGRMARLELHQHINVTRLGEVIAQHRAE